MRLDKHSQPYPEDAFNYLASAESRHWWFLARNQVIIWSLKKKVRPFQNFLEVGCGTGFVISGIAKAFPSSDLEASEYFEDGLVFARQRLTRCRFRQMDALSMHEVDAYDCIGCFDVLEHIDHDHSVLQNFNRAIRSGGTLLLTVPQHPWLWSPADNYAHHVRRYTSRELRDKVICAGFRIKYCSSFVSLLLPLMVLQRFMVRQHSYNLDDELRINQLLNSLLFLVMKLEMLLLRLGIRFPAGGSLLLLATKP